MQINGINSLQKKLLEIEKDYKNANKRSVKLICVEIQSQAKENFKGHPEYPNVISGNLKNHIEVKVQDIPGGVLGATGTKVEYAKYVEFGHNQEPGRFVPVLGKKLIATHVKAYPFFRPAVSQVIDSGHAKDIFIAEMRKVT